MFRFQVLGFLRSQEVFHGYALMKEYTRRTGRRYGAGYFYRQLSELAAERWVAPARKALGADPRRVPYQITDAGIRAFDDWFEETPRDPVGSDVIHVARALFFSQVEPDTAARVLAAWQRDLIEQSRTLERDLSSAEKRCSSPADLHPFLIRRDLGRVAGDLGFLEAVGSTIGSDRGARPRSGLGAGRRKR